MRKPIRIGEREFKYKKDALAYYKAILNSYNFDQSLNDSDFDDIIDLLNYDYYNYLIETENLEQEIIDDNQDVEQVSEIEDDIIEEDLNIEDIKVSQVQFNTKCFEIFYSNATSQYISYIMILNNKGYDSEKMFNMACRNSIIEDIRLVKQRYFDDNSLKGQVKCQETGELSKWTELVVDHRQPMTFSIIIDRFKEVERIDLEIIKYTSNDQNHIIFEDESLSKNFQSYHKSKAILRIVRKGCNSGRAKMARIKDTAKDLKIR